MATRGISKSEVRGQTRANGADVVNVPVVELKGQVGETAGKVWNALSSEGPLTLRELKKKVTNGESDLVSLALGWLAREDKIDITPERKTLRVQLK
jgi:hypothetical protein